MEQLGFIALVLVAILLLGWGLTRRRQFVVPFGAAGLLYKNGVFVRALEPGVHRVTDWTGTLQAVAVPVTTTALYAADITVLTKDQFSFRLSFNALVRVTDARDWYENRAPEASVGATGASGQVRLVNIDLPTYHALLNAAIVEWAGTRSLDEFLADPRAGLEDIKAAISTHFPGVTFEELLLTQITLPPEIRKMFTEVERAKREGQAALERARAEQASLRALANAARALQANPQLAQLRMLQAMETARGAKTFILGPTGEAGLPVTEKGK